MNRKLGCKFVGTSCDTYTPHYLCKSLFFMDIRWAHNPKVVGSNPTPATIIKPPSWGLCCCMEIGIVPNGSITTT